MSTMLAGGHTVSGMFCLKSPCRFCGQTFKNRRAHLSSCIGIFNGHYLIRRLGRTPVTGLQNGCSAGGSEGAGASNQRAGHDPGPDRNFASKNKDRQAKWSRPASKGNQQGRGKGQSQNSSKWESWSNWKDQDKNKGDLDQLKQQVDMLTTLVLRQKHQLMINRQDTSYIIFIRTDVTPSLAVTSFNIGQSWKQAKTSNPESLKHPLRVT